MNKVLSAVSLVASLWASTALAGELAIADGPGGTIAIVAKDNTLPEILTALGKRYGFEVEQGAAPAGAALSGQWKGSVVTVLESLLKSQSHLIVRNASKAGVGRVVLFDRGTVGNSATAAAAVPSPAAAGPEPKKDGEAKAAQAKDEAKRAESKDLTPEQAAELADENKAISPAMDLATLHAQQIAASFGVGPAAGGPGGAGAGSNSPPAPTANSHAELTRQVASNAQALAAGLQAICLSGSCAGRGK